MTWCGAAWLGVPTLQPVLSIAGRWMRSRGRPCLADRLGDRAVAGVPPSGPCVPQSALESGGRQQLQGTSGNGGEGWRAVSCPVDHRPAPKSPLDHSDFLWRRRRLAGNGNEAHPRTCSPSPAAVWGLALQATSDHPRSRPVYWRSSGAESPENLVRQLSFLSRAWYAAAWQRCSPLGLMLSVGAGRQPSDASIWGYGVRFLAVFKAGTGLCGLGAAPPKHRRIGHQPGLLMWISRVRARGRAWVPIAAAPAMKGPMLPVAWQP